MNGKKIGGIVLTVFGGIFLFMGLLFGVIFGLVGGAMGSASDEVNAEFEAFKENALEADGEIIEVDEDDNTTVIEYYSAIDDTYYQVEYSVVNVAFSEGDYIAVYYDMDSPNMSMSPDLVAETFDTVGTVFSGVGIGIGVVFVIIGLAFMIPGIILIKKSKTTYDN